MALGRAIELDETGSIVGEKPGERLLRATPLQSVRICEEVRWKPENNARKADRVASTSFQLKKQKHLRQITQNKKAGAQAPATTIEQRLGVNSPAWEVRLKVFRTYTFRWFLRWRLSIHRDQTFRPA
jgi:hypothetical protein